ncbi:hypothetical protein FS749_009474 [Ceratobasidium sp. UAMH 11750]|nr:hypothetical protein FS749_009474 [Ceratobasidium sp. UAMH 11750]
MPPKPKKTFHKHAPVNVVDRLKSKVEELEHIVHAPAFSQFRHWIVDFCRTMSSSNFSLESKWARPLGDIITRLNNFGSQPREERREQQRPLFMEFSYMLVAVTQTDSEGAQLACVTGALEYLKVATKPFSQLAKAAYKRELRRKNYLRLRLSQLQPLGELLNLTRPLQQMNLLELEALADEKKEILSKFKSIDLCSLRNATCRKCRKQKRKWNGSFPYNKHGGNAIPFVPGLFPRGKVRIRDVLQHEIKWITDGTTLGTVHDPDSSQPEIALFVHFPTPAEIDADTELYKELALLLHLGALNGMLCKRNGAHQAAGGCGIMMVLGWRSAVFDPTPYGLYAPPPGIQKDPELKKAWEEYVRNITRIREIFNIKFTEILAHKVAYEAQAFVSDKGLPAFGETTPDMS